MNKLEMVFVLLAVAGFGLIHLSDPAAIRRLPLVKPVVWTVGVALITYATLMASLSPHKIELPSWTTWLGWALLVGTLCVVVYGLFIKLPFHKTYVAAGVGDKLITTGFYSLVRHPWVHWSIILMISVILISTSRLILLASPLILFLEIVAVSVQDHFFFGKMFPGYERYRKDTPMLIPNGKSIRSFAASLRRKNLPWRKEGGDHDFELS